MGYHESFEKDKGRDYHWCEKCRRYEAGDCKYEERRQNLFMSVKEMRDN